MKKANNALEFCILFGSDPEMSARRALQRLVGDVEDPETDHEDGDGTGLGGLLKGVTGEVSKFSSVANEEDGCIKKKTIKKLSFFLNRQA
ncbi:hypothetical protein EV1_008926 [Malus domestica]